MTDRNCKEVQSAETKEANFFVSLGVVFTISISFCKLAMTNVKHSTTAAGVKEEGKANSFFVLIH